MMRKKIFKSVPGGLFFVIFILSHRLCVAGVTNEKDHIGATQTEGVPVTTELLNREGEPGPASPSFKMSDTSKFLVKKPYQEAEKLRMDPLAQSGEESLTDSSDEWFLGEEGDGSESVSTSELIDKK